ncbi:PLC-like phosphodiesterases superfamily protein [Zea mays]|nr:PLC-like phosphodiesterases superfamily protein [Zea mays]
MADGSCPKRTESKPMDSKAQSLVLLNFFTSNPSQSWACSNNSAPLISRLNACYHASAKRWPNYIAVDFYMRSNGGGAPLATDIANGRLQCGHDNIAHCKISSASAPAPASASSPAPASASSPSPAPAPDFAATSPAISSSPGPAPGPLNSYY